MTVRDLMCHLEEGRALPLWLTAERHLIGALIEWHPDGDEYAAYWEVTQSQQWTLVVDVDVRNGSPTPADLVERLFEEEGVTAAEVHTEDMLDRS